MSSQLLHGSSDGGLGVRGVCAYVKTLSRFWMRIGLGSEKVCLKNSEPLAGVHDPKGKCLLVEPSIAGF